MRQKALSRLTTMFKGMILSPVGDKLPLHSLTEVVSAHTVDGS